MKTNITKTLISLLILLITWVNAQAQNESAVVVSEKFTILSTTTDNTYLYAIGIDKRTNHDNESYGIYRLDTSTIPTTIKTLYVMSTKPTSFSFEYRDGMLYFYTDKLVKMTPLPGATPTAATSNNRDKVRVSLFPNPTQQNLFVQGLNKASGYTIYSMLGVEVMRGRVSSRTPIVLSHLAKGYYVLKLADGTMLKFIKN